MAMAVRHSDAVFTRLVAAAYIVRSMFGASARREQERREAVVPMSCQPPFCRCCCKVMVILLPSRHAVLQAYATATS